MNKTKFAALVFVFIFAVFLSFSLTSFAEGPGTITGVAPSQGGMPSYNVNNPQISQPQVYGENGALSSGSPFKWWGLTLSVSPFVSQSYTNPISQFNNVSSSITGVNGQSVSISSNDYGLANSSFKANGFAFKYHSFNHVLSVSDFLPSPLSWLLFFVPSVKNEYYYSSSNFNISYVNSSNLTMNTPDATIDGKMQELSVRYYWNPLGIDYPLSLAGGNITLVPYANLGIGGFADFFYAHDFTSNNAEDLLYVALTNSQAADNNYGQGLYGIGLRYGVGLQMFMNNLSATAAFHVLPYNFKRGFAAPGFISANQGFSIPNPNMNEKIFNIGARYNFAGNWYAGFDFEHDAFNVGSIGQTAVSLSGVNITSSSSGSASGNVTVDNYYNGGTITNNYLYISLGYYF